MLIAARADVDARNNDGNTALITAASNSRAESVKALIAAGADAEARNNNGSTALACAKRRGTVTDESKECISALESILRSSRCRKIYRMARRNRHCP